MRPTLRRPVPCRTGDFFHLGTDEEPPSAPSAPAAPAAAPAAAPEAAPAPASPAAAAAPEAPVGIRPGFILHQTKKKNKMNEGHHQEDHNHQEDHHHQEDCQASGGASSLPTGASLGKNDFRRLPPPAAEPPFSDGGEEYCLAACGSFSCNHCDKNTKVAWVCGGQVMCGDCYAFSTDIAFAEDVVALSGPSCVRYATPQCHHGGFSYCAHCVVGNLENGDLLFQRNAKVQGLFKTSGGWRGFDGKVTRVPRGALGAVSVLWSDNSCTQWLPARLWRNLCARRDFNNMAQPNTVSVCLRKDGTGTFVVTRGPNSDKFLAEHDVLAIYPAEILSEPLSSGQLAKAERARDAAYATAHAAYTPPTIPESICCPITQETLGKHGWGVAVLHGRFYHNAAIVRWVREKGTDPITRAGCRSRDIQKLVNNDVFSDFDNLVQESNKQAQAFSEAVNNIRKAEAAVAEAATGDPVVRVREVVAMCLLGDVGGAKDTLEHCSLDDPNAVRLLLSATKRLHELGPLVEAIVLKKKKHARDVAEEYMRIKQRCGPLGAQRAEQDATGLAVSAMQFEIDEIPKKIEAAVKAKTRSEAILHGIQNKQERYFDLPAEILQQVLDPLVEEAKLANENWNTCVERIADLRRELAERKKRLPELVQKCQRAQAAFAEASKDRKGLLGACKNLKARLRSMCEMWRLEMPPLDAPVTHSAKNQAGAEDSSTSSTYEYSDIEEYSDSSDDDSGNDGKRKRGE